MFLPQDFIERTKVSLGDEWEAFEESLGKEAPTSIRYGNKWREEIEGEEVPWCERGVYLEERPLFTSDPLFHAGGYYVQEASSMFVAQVVKQLVDKEVVALDLCAAPGGKSTLLAQMLPKGSMLVANEYVRQRAFILSENLQKCGETHCIVSNNAPKDYTQFKGIFDLVLVDAPCSGEGMFRKDPDSVKEWSVANVETCADRQKEILRAIYPTIKENGLLVYSTCTYNEKEDEGQVRWLCEEFDLERVDLETEESWGITKNEWGWHFYPHKTKGEGFFLSVLRKREATSSCKVKAGKSSSLKVELKGLKNREAYVPCEINNMVCAVPNAMKELTMMMNEKLNLLHAGIVMYEMKGKDLIPQTGLALSKEFDKESFSVVELNYEDAITFLQRESIYIENAPKGFVAVSYKGYPLGWVKNLGNRCNNLYPNEWRIRNKNVGRQ